MHITFLEAVGVGLGFLAIVAPDFWPRIPKGVSYALASVGLAWLTYSLILAVESYSGMNLKFGPLSLIVLGSAATCGGLFWHISRIDVGRRAEAASAKTSPASTELRRDIAEGGRGGSGEIFGRNGTVVGGKGGNVGLGGVGRGGDGGGGVIHGDGGTIIGGEGGSVDGVDIWFPPAQSSFTQFLESEGKTPDFGVQYPGAGGASGGWAQRQAVVAKLREAYFNEKGQISKIQSSKIEDVPLDYINAKLENAGYPWRARIERKYWYLYYVPRKH